jgi:hypothetical protein
MRRRSTPSRTTFGWEPLKTVLAEPNFRDLAQAYHRELWGEDRVPCAPDWARRQAMEDAGIYKLWVARVGPTLAGGIEWQIAPTLNAMTTMFAIDCGYYVIPAFRDDARFGWRMWKTALLALKGLGVTVVMSHDNIRHPLMPFFLGLGFKPMGTIYQKVL